MNKMIKKKGVIFAIIVFFILINMVGSVPKEKINKEVYEKLEENEEVPVVIKLKQEKIFKKVDLEEIKEEIIEDLEKEFREEEDLISVTVSEQELEKLEKNPDIEEISFSPQIKAFLQDSTILINATNVWPIQIDGINITGENETICILDTGANFTHPDLVGRNLTCNIDCFNKACVEDCSVSDDNGHGTHVAGIVGASGGISGTAINVNFIALKVLDENGNGHITNAEDDLTNAIDWCIENRNNYNISVITMSLGTVTLYNSYCDSTFSTTWANSINNATHFNISVIAATGNNGNFTHIASPACIQNITSVGATDKTDSLAESYSNRNNITDLVATGGTENNGVNGINSTAIGGGYTGMFGTSMSAPHVAGAFALIRQFFILQNSRVPTPDEIKETLNNTGVMIDDSAGSGYIFSRINVLGAIISLDNIAPNVTLISPVNEHINQTKNHTFSCNMTDDVGLKNVTLEIWDSFGNLYYNLTNETSGSFSSIDVDVNLSFGNYDWNCLVYDLNHNYSYAVSNFSLYIGNISVYLDFPSNNSYTNVNDTNFTCLSYTIGDLNLTNITFFIWNSTNDLSYNETQDISGKHNSTEFKYNLTIEESYTWNCLSLNNDSQSAYADSNFTINFDLTEPEISSIASSVTSSSVTITWTTNEPANSSVNYGSGVGLGGYNSSSTLTTSHSLILSGLSASTTYYYNLSSCDESGNCVVNGTYSFTTSAADSGGTTSSGGGGGAASTVKTYTLTTEQASSGYTQTLSKDDKIKFTFFDKSSGEHTLTIKEITENSVSLTIFSEPITLTLGIGQSAKLNLSSVEYYDLYIKLNSIKNNKVDITIQTIQEEIPKPLITGKAVEDKEEEPSKADEKEQETPVDLIDKVKNILIIILVISVTILFIERFIKEKNKSKLKRLKKKLKE